MIERESMRALCGWHPAICDWPTKMEIPLHFWQDALHADQLRQRVLELRYPLRDVDTGHDEDLVTWLGELVKAPGEVEFLAGVYQVVKPALVRAYQAYLSETDTINDRPTVHFLEKNESDERAHIDWAEARLDFLTGDSGPLEREVKEWVEYLERFLSTIGGIWGDGERSAPPPSPPAGYQRNFEPARAGKSDLGFQPALVHLQLPGWNPPKPQLEKQLYETISHANEHWACEAMALAVWEWNDMPWEFYVDATRWGYDEVRHALLGQRRLEKWGLTIGQDYPIAHDAYDSTAPHGAIYAVGVLHYHESRAIPGKRESKARFETLGDGATAQDYDYDWADERLHAATGWKWLMHRLGQNRDEVHELKEKAHDMEIAWIKRVLKEDPRADLTPFVERIRGRLPSMLREAPL